MKKIVSLGLPAFCLCACVDMVSSPQGTISTNGFIECQEVTDDPKICSVYMDCLTRDAASKISTKGNSSRVVSSIIPYDKNDYNKSTSISQMRSNAERSGPEAVRMFNVIYTIRQQCLVETGLRDKISDD